MANITISPEAEDDFEQAFDYYYAQNESVAYRFDVAFDRALAEVSWNPLTHPKIDDEHRFYMLNKFPYYIVYRVASDQIRVIAVAHSKRKLGYWTGRN